MHRVIPLILAAVAAALQAVESAPDPQVRDGERIVFVGDSITGLSVNYGPAGYAGVIRRALDAARPGNRIRLVSLGGSGQSVGSWMDIVRRSAQAEVVLDVPGVDVRSTLAEPGGVLVIMLGMNDTLAPYASADEAGVEAWAGRYRSLIGALRERARPRLVALATITPDSEDPASPKNRLVDLLNRRLVVLAGELGCLVLPSGAAVREVLAEGRTMRPDFHVTYDFVHPEAAGHAAIAYGMLAGLGERAAAESVRTAVLDPLLEKARGGLPAVSYTVRSTLPAGGDAAQLDISWHRHPSTAGAQPPAVLSAPAGWTVRSAEPAGGTGAFTATGTLDHLVNRFGLKVGQGGSASERDIVIPAPWLIGHGFANPAVWAHGTWVFQPDQGRMPGEEALLRGAGWGGTPDGWTGGPLEWTRYLASVDHTGGATAGNVNLFAVDPAGTFAGAYGVRWIYSDRDRALRIVLGNATFAGQTAVQVVVNGMPIYAGVISAEPQRTSERQASLRPGWNVVAFKTNHVNWQWQFSLDLAAAPGESLDDLIVSTQPR